MVATNYKFDLDFPVLSAHERESIIRQVQIRTVPGARRIAKEAKPRVPKRTRGGVLLRDRTGSRILRGAKLEAARRAGNVREFRPGALRRSLRGAKPRRRDVARTGAGYFVAARLEFLYYMHFQTIWQTTLSRELADSLEREAGRVLEDILLDEGLGGR